jgi:hypothetical protein
MSETVRPHILYILSVIVDIWILWIDKVGIMNDSFMCVIHAVHFKIIKCSTYRHPILREIIVFNVKMSLFFGSIMARTSYMSIRWWFCPNSSGSTHSSFFGNCVHIFSIFWVSETVPWTFQINSCRFTRPHILYILSVIVDIWILWIDKVGIMNDSFMCVIHAVHTRYPIYVTTL